VSRSRRSLDWGFPRWRPYGCAHEAAKVRICDREGCNEPATCPAPKAPNSRERWYFCQKHAAEYNASWDYFAGLDQAERQEREAAEQRARAGYAEAAHYRWAGPGDGSRSADEMRALEVLGLGPDADFASVKKAYRARAKQVHPDVKPGDAEAARQFQLIQASYEVLRAAEERREWRG
jgi:hypothetical protein